MEIVFTPDPALVKKLSKSNVIPFPRTKEMGDRFYQEQLDTLGDCPGNKNPKRRTRRVPWTDEQKAEAVEAYTDSDPTPETSMEIVKQIADDMGQSPNGVRMILTKAGVYVKKTPAAKSNGASASTSTRVSKAAAIDDLTAAITDIGGTVDEDIVSKLTGKAAMYFAGLLRETH